MEEYNNDKTYMVLVIITFLAFAVAIGFAFGEWSQLNDVEYIIDTNSYPARP